MNQGTAKNVVKNPFQSRSTIEKKANLLDTLVMKKPNTQGNPVLTSQTSSNENESANIDITKQPEKATIPSLIQRNQIILKNINSRRKSQATATDGSSINAIKSVSEVERLVCDNLQLSMALPGEKMRALNQKAKLISMVSNCLQPLYKTIQNNCQLIKRQLHCKIHTNKFRQIKLTQTQYCRLMQGLFFYKPIPNIAIDFLQRGFQNHPLAEQLRQVSTSFKLDYLKSYYVLKEIYAQKKNYRPNGFTFTLQKAQLINTRQVVELARQFLAVDKKNLLGCYQLLLGGNCRPSLGKICLVRQEIDWLWGCISMLQTEPSQIQEMFFTLYLKYCSFNQPQQPSFLQKQLLLMKKKMSKMNLHSSIKSQLQQMSVDEMLEQGQFRVQDCQAHFRDMVQFIIYKQDIDFQQAIQRFPKNVQLSDKWTKYFNSFLLSVSFPKDRKSNVLKAIYLYKIMSHLASESQRVDQKVEYKVIRQIFKLSGGLSIYFVSVIRQTIVKVWFIKTIICCEDKEFKEADPDIRAILQKYVGSFQIDKIIQLLVNTIPKVIQVCLESYGLMFLQNQISSARSIMYGFDQQNIVYEVIKFYNKVFLKIPSQQEKIQSDIITIFKRIKKQHNIGASFSCFNGSLLAKTTNPYIIAKHLSFTLEILNSIDDIIQTLKEWFHLIRMQSIQYYFDIFAQFFLSFSEKLVESSLNVKGVDIVMEGIRIFGHSIYFYLCSQTHNKCTITSNQVRIMRMFYQIKQYCCLVGRDVDEDVEQLFEEMKQKIQEKMASPLFILTNIDLDLMMSQRLMLFNILTCSKTQKGALLDHRNKSKLMGLLQKEKTLNMLNIIGHVSSQLRVQSSLGVIDLISNAAETDQTLTKSIVKQNGPALIEALLNLNKLSFLDADKIVNILISLYNFSYEHLCEQQKQKYMVIINTMQILLMKWLQQAQFPQSTFQKIIALATKAMNGLKYGHHIILLEAGRRKEYLFKISIMQQVKVQNYSLYLLCMMASLKKGSIDLRCDKDFAQLKSQLLIFSELAIVIINSYFQLESKEQLSNFSKKYITKLLKLYLQLLKEPVTSFFIKQQLKRINAAFERYQIKFGQDAFLAAQAASFSQCLQFQSSHSSLQQIDVSVCNEEQKFNEVYIKNVRVIENQVKLQRSGYYLSRLVIFLQANRKMKIKLIGFNKVAALRLINDTQTMAIFIKTLIIILGMIHYEFAKKKINANIIAELLGQLTINHREGVSLEQLVIDKLKLTIVTTAIQNSLISVFFIINNFNNHVVRFLQNLSNYLTNWQQPQETIAPTLTTTRIELSYYPKRLRSRFTLWNLLEFREKLALVLKILNYCLQMNGLNHIKQYRLVQTMIDYLQLVKKNKEVLNSVQFSQQVRLINDFLSQKHSKVTSPFNYSKQHVSYSLLRQMSAQIGESLNLLDCEFNEQSLQFFSDFTDQLTQ